MATNFLVNEDDGQYYAGQQYFTGQTGAGSGGDKVIQATNSNIDLVSA